jgi:hypothetical protein
MTSARTDETSGGAYLKTTAGGVGTNLPHNYNTITAKHSYAPSTSIQDTTAISINNDTSLLDHSHISARGGGISMAPSPNLM